MSKVVEDAYTDTWLTEEGLADPLLTGQGTKAGDPLGDLMYNFLMAKALRQIRKQLQDLGLSLEIPWDGQRSPFPGEESNCAAPLSDVSFVDDGLFFVIAASATELWEKIHVLVPIIIEVFKRFGVDLNFGVGKTEIMIMFYGLGSTKHRVLLHVHQKSLLHVAASGTVVHLRAVASYKHLGGLVSLKGEMLPEVKNRANSGIVAMSGIRAEAAVGGSAMGCGMSEIITALWLNINPLQYLLVGFSQGIRGLR